MSTEEKLIWSPKNSRIETELRVNSMHLIPPVVVNDYPLIISSGQLRRIFEEFESNHRLVEFSIDFRYSPPLIG